MPALHELLPPPLAAWVAEQAESMGLPGPDNYILLLVRLAKQHHDHAAVPDLYRRIFHGLPVAESPQPNNVLSPQAAD
jgi:hypothetical protein